MTKPKVLFFDIETFPNIGYCWGKWEQNIIKFMKEWELASFAYKWLGASTVKCLSRKDLTEKQLVASLYKLFNEADIVIAHNGDSFDLKKARTKFLQYGLKPSALSKSVDTKKMAKNQFSFNSNSLNDLGETLGLGKKVETGGFDLWLGCMAGSEKSWSKMIKYNKQDVVLLEKVYNKLKAWNPTHPNLAALQNKPGCGICLSFQVQARGFTATSKTRQQRYQCQSCGHWFTGKVAKK